MMIWQFPILYHSVLNALQRTPEVFKKETTVRPATEAHIRRNHQLLEKKNSCSYTIALNQTRKFYQFEQLSTVITNV